MADYLPTRRTPSAQLAGAAGIGPGYYTVLGIPRDASSTIIHEAHARAVDKMRTSELEYEEKTEKTEAVKEERVRELQLALDTLCDPKLRYRHDRQHNIWDATWTVGRYQNAAAGPPSLSRSGPSARSADRWVADQDARVTTSGMTWRAPESRATWEARKRSEEERRRHGNGNNSRRDSGYGEDETRGSARGA